MHDDPFIKFFAPLSIGIIEYCELKNRILHLILPLDQPDHLIPVRKPVHHVPHSEPDPLASPHKLDDSVGRYPLLRERDLNVSDPSFDQQLDNLVQVCLLQEGVELRVLWVLVVERDFEVAQVFEVLLTDAHNAAKLRDAIDCGLERGQVGEGL